MASDYEGRDQAVSTETGKDIDPDKVTIPAGCGCIYIIKYGPYYKIGKTVDPSRRHQIARSMNRAMTVTPFNAEVQLAFFCWLRNLDFVERSLHQKFESVRKGGEWFELTREQYRWIAEQEELPYWDYPCTCKCERCTTVQFNLNYVRRASIPCPS